MTDRVHAALSRALRLVGHRPDRYDVDAVIGSLLSDGIQVIATAEMDQLMFGDRCDFECPTCHPTDEETTT